MGERRQRVCPVECAGGLDNRVRRWFQNPGKILGPYIKEGMTVLDVGCGPGFFSLEMARLVGASGRVISADLQEGMLQKLRSKISGSALEKRIILHQSAAHEIGVKDSVDFVLAFYMVHEVPDQQKFLTEIKSLLKPKGLLLIVEPPMHVSRKAFEETVARAQNTGFAVSERPYVFLSKAVVLKNT